MHKRHFTIPYVAEKLPIIISYTYFHHVTIPGLLSYLSNSEKIPIYHTSFFDLRFESIFEAPELRELVFFLTP